LHGVGELVDEGEVVFVERSLVDIEEGVEVVVKVGYTNRINY
jgi:hypothetical protein